MYFTLNQMYHLHSLIIEKNALLSAGTFVNEGFPQKKENLKSGCERKIKILALDDME